MENQMWGAFFMDDTGQSSCRNIFWVELTFLSARVSGSVLSHPYMLWLLVYSGLAPLLVCLGHVWSCRPVFCYFLLDAWNVFKPHLHSLCFSLRESLAWWWLALAELALYGWRTCGIHMLPQHSWTWLASYLGGLHLLYALLFMGSPLG